MKITFFGLTLSSSWGNGHATPLRAMIRGLAAEGHTVVFYEKDAPYYARHRDLPAPDYCTLKLYHEWLNVRREAMADARSSDVVITTSFLPDGAAIVDELLPLERPLRVYYDLDTPVTLARFHSGGAVDYVIPEQLWAFDLVLSFTGGRALDELRDDFGVAHAAAIHGCVDPDIHFRVRPGEFFASDLSYLGTYSADRQHNLNELFFAAARRLPQRKFLLVGSMFPEGLDWPRNVWYKPHIGPDQHPAFYSSSCVTLNITRGDMAAYGHCPSGRFFEAAACGTPLISDHFVGLEDFFDLGREIIAARSTDDVVRALALPREELAAMAARARARTLDEHTGRVRGRQMLAAFESVRERAVAGAA